MFLTDTENGHLVEVLDWRALMDPSKTEFEGRYNWGEEMPDPEQFAKSSMRFESGEALPRCWTDLHYRDSELRR